MFISVKMQVMIDLHTHSNASDGDYSPALLVQEAEKRGIAAIALTDHDTINGLEIAETEAKTRGIRFIPGIEISIRWTGDAGISGIGPGGEFHLLGLGIISPSPAFLAAIAELSRRREERNREILDRMHELSIDASWEDVLDISSGHSVGAQNQHGEAMSANNMARHGPNEVPRKTDGEFALANSVGRPHFASLLVSKKIVRNMEQAFSRYLKPGKPLYVPKTGLEFDEAVSIIRESGGIPVLAHPMSLFVAWGRLPDLAKALKDRGLMGLEAWHPTARQKSCRRLEELGRRLGLYITEGSDFHGSIRPDRKLGCSSRGREINDSVLEAIPELR